MRFQIDFYLAVVVVVVRASHDHHSKLLITIKSSLIE